MDFANGEYYLFCYNVPVFLMNKTVQAVVVQACGSTNDGNAGCGSMKIPSPNNIARRRETFLMMFDDAAPAIGTDGSGCTFQAGYESNGNHTVIASGEDGNMELRDI